MPKLINRDGVFEDTWTIAEANQDIEAALKKGGALIPLSYYLAQADHFTEIDKPFGVWVESADDIEKLTDKHQHLAVVAFRFVSFMDGRHFSSARILHDHLDFQGDIRAIGAFIRDQVFYLSRCGFSSFSVPDDCQTQSMQESLCEISERYQAGCDEPQPLFRRRA